jgi:DNA-binding NarL/FixJ family response regulator
LEYSNREIGQSLGISEQTVKNHLSAIFGKMKVSRRSDLTLETFNSREPDVTIQTQSDLTRERPH